MMLILGQGALATRSSGIRTRIRMQPALICTNLADDDLAQGQELEQWRRQQLEPHAGGSLNPDGY